MSISPDHQIIAQPVLSSAPKIDILLPCYNSSATIFRTIESIRAQTFKNFRVILVDNNSSDNSKKIFCSFGDQRFECRSHGETVSLGANFNRCLDYVEADYYCIMHADDEYLPGYLEAMVEALARNPDAILAFCNAHIIDEFSRRRFSIKNAIKRSVSSSNDAKYSGCEGLVWISEYNKIIAPSVMYRREAITRIGRFNPALKFTLDWEYYFRALKEGTCLLRLNEVLFNYRVHSKQQTAFLISSMEKYHEMHAFLNGIHEHIGKACNGAPHSRYKYFRCTIIADIFVDLENLSFFSALCKLRFLIKLDRSKLLP